MGGTSLCVPETADMWRKEKEILLVNFEMSYTGSPRALLNLALCLRELGYEPSVWTLNEGPFQKEFGDIGIEVKAIRYPGDIGSEMENVLKEYGLIIANTVFCASFASYAGKFTKTVLYIMEAGNLQQLVQDCCLNADDIVNASHLLCVSKYAKKCIQAAYPIKRIKILHNYIEPWNGERRIKKRDEIIRFVVSGTIEHRKGQDVAERAFLSLPEKMQEKSELHFVGPAPKWSLEYQDELHAMQTKHVKFHEEIRDRDELFRLYDEMDVVIVASRDESCSLVALEAAMLGKAILMTENTGAKYIVDKVCILPTGNSAVLARNMMKCIREPEILLRLGKHNHDRYLKMGTKNIFMKKLKKVMSGF